MSASVPVELANAFPRIVMKARRHGLNQQARWGRLEVGSHWLCQRLPFLASGLLTHPFRSVHLFRTGHAGINPNTTATKNPAGAGLLLGFLWPVAQSQTPDSGVPSALTPGYASEARGTRANAERKETGSV